MATPTPQEIQVWYLIPALRKAIAKALITELRMNQKQVAEIFGVTPAAISQYMTQKRGSELQFTKSDHKHITNTAKQIAAHPQKSTEYIYQLTQQFKSHNALCKLHRQHDKNLPKNCKICVQ